MEVEIGIANEAEVDEDDEDKAAEGRESSFCQAEMKVQRLQPRY